MASQANARKGSGRHASAPAPDEGTAMRIGDLARLVGTTPRTIRYYEEIGLLPAAAERHAGVHRLYGASDVERLREIMSLRQLLGVSLEELKELLSAQEARAALKAEYHREDLSPARRREVLAESLVHIERQLALVERRVRELSGLRDELRGRAKRIRALLAEGKQGAAQRRKAAAGGRA